MKKRKYSVTGIGNAIVDVIANVEEGFLSVCNLIKGTMRLVCEEEAESLHSRISVKKTISGGSAANTIAGLAVLGNNVAFIGKVKNDELGHAFENNLNALGVTFLTKKAEGDVPSTARCIVLTTPDAQRTMSTCLGIAGFLTEDDIDENLIKNSSILYIEGYLWDQKIALRAVRKAIDAAKKYDCRIALSLSDPFCVQRNRKDFLKIIRGCVDFLFANEAEILFLFETDDINTAVDKCKNLVSVAALTRAEHGSIIVTKNDTIKIEAEKAAVIDSTGAGDMYAAGFLNGLLKGKKLYECGRMGSILAAGILGHYGARPEKQLIELLAESIF
ncbi:MAG: adenosine kinase [Actinobacteria bacterium]|nr:adenosine kinase [Actinomycetota bacterium]MBM3712844.1 adenosine kinase [Actinomycetota bacterium]